MADFWGFLTRFCFSGMIPRCSNARRCFTIISCVAATTQKFINKMEAKVFIHTVFEFKSAKNI